MFARGDATDHPLTRVLQSPVLGSRRMLGSREVLGSRKVYVAAAVLVAAVAGSLFVAARPAASQVPDLRGMSVAAAMRTLHDRGIGAERRAVDAPDSHRGDVLGQQPAPGTHAEDDTVVVLRVASGRVDLVDGDLLGESYAQASRDVTAMGLVPTRVDEPRYEGLGSVVAVGPSGRLPLGSTVTLTVAVPHPAPPAPVKHHERSHHESKPHGHGKGHKHGD